MPSMKSIERTGERLLTQLGAAKNAPPKKKTMTDRIEAIKAVIRLVLDKDKVFLPVQTLNEVAQAADAACLEALREPSEEMIEAAARECVKRQGHGDPDSLHEGLPLWALYVDEPKWSFPVMIKTAGEEDD